MFTTNASRGIIGISRVVFICAICYFLNNSRLPITRHSTKGVRAHIQTRTTRVLVEGSNGLYQETPRNFSGLTTKQTMVSTITPIVTHGSTMVGHGNSLFKHYLPGPHGRHYVIIHTSVYCNVRQVIVQRVYTISTQIGTRLCCARAKRPDFVGRLYSVLTGRTRVLYGGEGISRFFLCNIGGFRSKSLSPFTIFHHFFIHEGDPV